MESIASVSKKRIFISPLDWGLGHASRLVPLIANLRDQGHFILLGTEPKTAAFLKTIFPDIPQIPFKAYGIKYGKGNNLAWTLLKQIPKIKLAIFSEYFALKKIVREHQIDTIISDSRFGLRNKNTQNFIISHQLQIPYPKQLRLFGWLLNKTNQLLLNRFDGCLVPDDEDHRFSGILSQNKNIKNVQFLGPLSRFSLLNKKGSIAKNEELVFVFSGPEPQRSIFEKIVINQLKQTSYSALLISGQPEKTFEQQISPTIRKVAHLSDSDFAKTLQQATCVFSRSGYSSLMDYAALNLDQIVLIPTPDQTEQEYLAKKFNENDCCFTSRQNEFSLIDSLKQVKSYKGFRTEDFFLESEIPNFF